MCKNNNYFSFIKTSSLFLQKIARNQYGFRAIYYADAEFAATVFSRSTWHR
jgi:hypothetical protein